MDTILYLIIIIIFVIILIYNEITKSQCNYDPTDIIRGPEKFLNLLIPKNIYMCYKTKDIPPYIINNWKKLNPDYNIYLYDDKMCLDFLQKYYNKEYVDIFNFIKDGPIKSDFWRVCILYKFGGVYTDVDIRPVIPIKDFIEKDVTFLTCISYIYNNVNPHFIICPPKNHIIKKSIDKYINMYRNNIKYGYWEWSIVYIFRTILRNHFNKYINMDGVYSKDNIKYQFLKEIHKKPASKMYCTYNNKIILYNRYETYNMIDHSF